MDNRQNKIIAIEVPIYAGSSSGGRSRPPARIRGKGPPSVVSVRFGGLRNEVDLAQWPRLKMDRSPSRFFYSRAMIDGSLAPRTTKIPCREFCQFLLRG
jgi:hypothetical protein